MRGPSIGQRCVVDDGGAREWMTEGESSIADDDELRRRGRLERRHRDVELARRTLQRPALRVPGKRGEEEHALALRREAKDAVEKRFLRGGAPVEQADCVLPSGFSREGQVAREREQGQ